MIMTNEQMEWNAARKQLVDETVHLGFPRELGYEIAKNLGSPKAMYRMITYLKNVKPRKAELVVDEMLAICSEIAEWKKRKESQAANAKYNEILNYGLGEEEPK